MLAKASAQIIATYEENRFHELNLGCMQRKILHPNGLSEYLDPSSLTTDP